MSKIVVVNNLSLDGVVQAPGRADEDTRDGFTRGGWAVPFGDRAGGEAMGKHMMGTRALLLGRRTYVDFAGFWPKQGADNPFTGMLARTPKYVASTTLDPVQEWENTIVLGTELLERVAALRAEDGGDIVILGSGQLVRTLVRAGLVDEFVLLVHPLVLGSGRRLFDDQWTGDLTLTDNVVTTTGVFIGTYRVEPKGAGA